MSDDRISPPPARARAVADAPVGALVARAEELARRWALALLGARPLAEMSGVALEDIARYAPALCISVARSLSSEEELASLDARARDPGGRSSSAAAGLRALAACWDAATAVEQIEALRGVIWRATLQELRDPSARQVADLSDRLASVCATALACALAERPGTAHEPVPPPAFAAPREQVPPREQVLYSAPAPSPGALRAVLIDEREEAQRSAQRRTAWRRDDGPPPPAPGGGAHSPERPGAANRPGPHASPTTPRPLPWDTPLQRSAVSSEVAPQPTEGDGSMEQIDDPVMRVRRGPGTPADRQRS
ncbi:MAG: hypothetical protein ACHQHO_10910 [Solirubrobacterales bacterium]